MWSVCIWNVDHSLAWLFFLLTILSPLEGLFFFEDVYLFFYLSFSNSFFLFYSHILCCLSMIYFSILFLFSSPSVMSFSKPGGVQNEIDGFLLFSSSVVVSVDDNSDVDVDDVDEREDVSVVWFDSDETWLDECWIYSNYIFYPIWFYKNGQLLIGIYWTFEVCYRRRSYWIYDSYYYYKIYCSYIFFN